LRPLDGDRIRRAIDKAEAGTSGRIGVRVVRGNPGDALESARNHFHQAGLHERPERNGVLLLIAPDARRLAVFGGDAIHARVGDAFWSLVVSDMSAHFAQGNPTEGLEHGIARVGEQLRLHFPREDT